MPIMLNLMQNSKSIKKKKGEICEISKSVGRESLFEKVNYYSPPHRKASSYEIGLLCGVNSSD